MTDLSKYIKDLEEQIKKQEQNYVDSVLEYDEGLQIENTKEANSPRKIIYIPLKDKNKSFLESFKKSLSPLNRSEKNSNKNQQGATNIDFIGHETWITLI